MDEMRTRPSTFPIDPSAGSCFKPGFLGRFGHELALVYHDTLQAPLPTRLQGLIDRMEQASRADSARQEAASRSTADAQPSTGPRAGHDAPGPASRDRTRA